MTNQYSERFYDHERLDIYAELVQAGLDRPQGVEQSYMLDRIASTEPLPPLRASLRLKISFRWFAPPRLPVPFLTWA